MLVLDCMTKEVVTVEPETTGYQALRLCRQRRIRHLPVMEDNRLVGIISDRDLRDAAPPLGASERAEVLQRMHVGEAMRREVVTAHPLDPIEHAARDMSERSIGSLPVVSEGELVGILTASDVMRALMRLVGADEPGSRVELEIRDRPGSLAGIFAILSELNVNVVSVLSSPGEESGKNSTVLRLGVINALPAIKALKAAGYNVLWPPEPEE